MDASIESNIDAIHMSLSKSFCKSRLGASLINKVTLHLNWWILQRIGSWKPRLVNIWLGVLFLCRKVARKRSIPNVLASLLIGKWVNLVEDRKLSQVENASILVKQSIYCRRNCTKFLALKGEGNESFYLGWKMSTGESHRFLGVCTQYIYMQGFNFSDFFG